ncbi:MAG: glycosyltransferase [Dehalococcoidia bacterium]|nr:glycosyltransferase [Dehalococcoidia bacterium]
MSQDSCTDGQQVGTKSIRDTLVFVPALNEAPTIWRVCAGVLSSFECDVLVVDDGSTDGTGAAVADLPVMLVRHDAPRSPASIVEALEFGVTNGYQWIVKVDGDLQHDPADAVRLVAAAKEHGADIVLGSRHLHGFAGKSSFLESAGMMFSRVLVSVFTRQRISDPTSGLRLWSRRAAIATVNAKASGLLKRDSTYLIEELLVSGRHGLRLAEVAVVMHPRTHGVSRSYNARAKMHFPVELICAVLRALRYRPDRQEA